MKRIADLSFILALAAMIFSFVLALPAWGDSSQYTIVGASGGGSNVACGAASASSGSPPGGTTHVRIACVGSTGCRIRLDGIAATVTNLLVNTGVSDVFRMPVGGTVACIQDTAAANISVVFLQANVKTDTNGNYQPGLNP